MPDVVCPLPHVSQIVPGTKEPQEANSGTISACISTHLKKWVKEWPVMLLLVCSCDFEVFLTVTVSSHHQCECVCEGKMGVFCFSFGFFKHWLQTLGLAWLSELG